jgi:hypothetical protein
MNNNKPKDCPNVIIRLPGMSGGEVLLDGVRVPGVCDVRLDAQLGKPTVLTLTIKAWAVEFEGPALVEQVQA